MSKISFVYGRAHAGKSAFIYDYYCDQMKADADNEFVFLVPDQMTLGVQKALIKHKNNRSLYHTSVFGFTRLAYKLYEEQHISIPTVLDDVGKLLLLQKALQNLYGQLSLFKGNIKKQGFLQSLSDLMKEMTEYRITDDIALDALAKQQNKKQLSDKITDILKIRREYERLKGKTYVAAEDILSNTVQYIAKSPLICNSEIVIDGFSTFTKLQYEIIAEIMKYAKKVTFVLDMDSLPSGTVTDVELFYQPKQIYMALSQLADKLGISDREYHLCEKQYPDNALSHLEQTYEQKFGRYTGKADNLHIVNCHDLSAEIDYVLSKVSELTANGYHYRDIAIVTTELDAYTELIDEKFTEIGIPYYSDHKKSLFHNIAVEGLLSAIAVCNQGFSYESVFRYLKSGLFTVSEEMDKLDIYVSALGIRGINSYKNKFSERSYKPERFDEDMIADLDEYKTDVLKSVIKLNANMNGTISERLEAVKIWLAETEVAKKVEELSDKLKNTDAQLALVYNQTMEIIDGIITQLQEILGQEEIETGDLYRLLETGFSQKGVGTIPNYLDQLVIGDIKRSRLSNVKVLFVIGVNDKVFPGGEPVVGLLTDADRDTLKDSGMELNGNAREQSIAMKYFVYRLLAKPTDALFLTYSNTGEDQKKLFPSFVIGQIKRLFPELKEETSGRSIYHIRQGLNALADREGFGLSDDEYEALMSEYAGRSEYQEEYKKILSAKAGCINQAEVIDENHALTLFDADGDRKPKITVSRLEKYAGCEMRHFLKYGLGLKERQKSEIRSSDIGNYYHTILDTFFRTAKDNNISLSSAMTSENRRLLIDAGFNALSEKYSVELMESTSKNKYILEQIKEVVGLNLDAILLQLSAGSMNVLATEVSFGMKNEDDFSYKAYSIPESRFDLRGTIDRVDVGFDENGREILRVIDYKSGSTDLDYNKIAEGLQLQLLLYLAGLKDNEAKRTKKENKVGGAYYYHIYDDNIKISRDTIYNSDGSMLSDDEINEAVSEARYKEMMLSGLSASEFDTLGIMERDFKNAAGTVKSRVVKSLSTKKDGGWQSYAKICDAKGFDNLIKYVIDKTVKLGDSILSGSVEPNPYRDGEFTACDHCEFCGRCGFDESLGYKFRRLKSGTVLSELTNSEDE